MFRSVIILLAGLGLSSVVTGQTIGEISGQDPEKSAVTVIEPETDVEPVQVAKIDTERFELGGYVGSISIADFNTVLMTGVSASYHIGDRYMASIAYGKSGEPEASFESNVGGNFLPDRDQGFQYVATYGSYRLFDGRTFFGSSKKFNSHIYLDAGLDSVTFGGESNIGLVLGVQYKLVLSDWLTGNLIFRDHIVSREFLGEDKLTQNIEFGLGFNALF